ncbi:putative aldolase-type TIM barrel [Helianthus anomalus]
MCYDSSGKSQPMVSPYIVLKVGLASHIVRVVSTLKAQEFIDETGIDALAMFIGNVHGSTLQAGQSFCLIC